MNWDFLDVLTDVLDLLGNTSTSPETNYHQKVPVKKKTKYLTEKISAVLLFFFPFCCSSFLKILHLLKIMLQTLIVCSLIGFSISLVFFFILYSLEKYYFKNVFQWIFFSVSVISFFISLVFCIYFKSGLFI